MLPTVLVCPFQVGFPLTRVRVAVEWFGQEYLVLCELARPIHRRALEPAGELSENDSLSVMAIFRLVLAR